MLPLHGLKVLELGSVLMAPYAGQWLADLGADVIKIEPPLGDSTRTTGPGLEDGLACVFVGLNRNKRSVVLDLKTDEGRRALLELVKNADVLLHNNRPQKMEGMGLGPDVLLGHNPRLIYAGFHGFAQNGPYGGRPAYDDIIQGASGLADLMSKQGGAPAYLPTVVADKTAGLVGVIGILAAVAKRERTGLGGYVEIPMFETMVAYTAVEHLYGRHFEPPLAPAGYPRALTPHRRPFATQDGHICVLPYTDAHWTALFSACGRDDLAGDPRFADISARTANIAALYAALADLLATRTSQAWLDLLRALDIPCGPVASLDDLIEDPHLAATGFFSEHRQDDGQVVRFPGSPVLFDGDRMPIRPPPRLGQHTREVLEESGLSPEMIDAILSQSAQTSA